ncbi:cache domain-containing protein [Nocardioides nematodiphilus]|uniref:cache domain-containing protein n=1 Tax=Nocardioides nematodiphilus TaxID=2849669 RepID=UPI001CD96BFC|nr:cache domain-containing protein [Nocardioides nematodiphilus]MCA1984596.1 cache domain-containing protein [Nocardioides nematodiphilus]
MTADVVRSAVEQIGRRLEDQLAPLRGLADQVAHAAQGVAVGALREKDLAHLIAWITAELESEAAYVSLGFAAASGVMAERDHYLLWLQRRAGGIGRLRINLSQNDPDLYDYFDMEWFSGAERRKEPSIYGPYVDYAGADFLVLTVAVPVQVGSRFVGVAGADLDPDELERWLVPLLRALPGEALVVNGDRSVLASGSARWMPGERLAVHPAAAPEGWRTVVELSPWTGWTLALAEPEVDRA